MLSTLLKIGEWQSQGKGEWDRFLDYPKVEYKDNKGNEISNLTLSIIFDLDEMEVIIDKGNIKEFDESEVSRLKAVKVKGGNNKANYVTVPASKLVQLYKTFYGKEGTEAVIGEMVESINKTDPSLLTDKLKAILESIHQLKDKFLERINPENQDKITSKPLEDNLEFGKSENLVLVTTQVKSAEHGFPKPTYFADIPDYQSVLDSQYFGKPEGEKEKTPGGKKLCYASGEVADDVEELDLSSRYSLNKMFVTETKNYASDFKEKAFSKNYQVSQGNQEKLDYASDYILNKGAYKVRIANIDHAIIPQFRESENLDWELALTGIKMKSDMLFGFSEMENFVKTVKEETNDIFWINFLAYESDGNFFKSTELIKDVSNFHFQTVLQTFRDIDWECRETTFLNWNSVMTQYGKGTYFNLNTIYGLIPIRKDKEKKNKALDLFKSILENREVEYTKLFGYFCELILCHYYERYNSYTNIAKSSKDYFGLAVRNSVFKYLAFILVLKKINLITMDETNTATPGEAGNKYDQAIQNFFERMHLNQDQQAMFYLGRMLNTVEFIQKGKNKTVIQKVNFNGMDRDEIQRLRNGLLEKAKQYNKVGKVIFTDRKFGELFDYNKWATEPMNQQEAVFYLLTGYSFGISNKEAGEIDSAEETEHN